MALERARDCGKPLLVLLVPSEEAAMLNRGNLWGHYLANLTDEEALDLSLCEVTCATAAEVANVTKLGPIDGKGETTWAVLVETDVLPASAVSVSGNISSGPGDEIQQSKELRVALAKLLRQAIVPDEASQKRRLAQSSAKPLDGKSIGALEADDDRARFESLNLGKVTRRVDLDRFAAHVRFGMVSEATTDGSDPKSRLADAVRIRLFESAPSGAKWMFQSTWCPPCGMGFMPAESRFFLKFLTQ